MNFERTGVDDLLFTLFTSFILYPSYFAPVNDLSHLIEFYARDTKFIKSLYIEFVESKT